MRGAGMNDYISREAALSAQDKSMNLKEMRERLKRIPAADVAPVVHGKWLYLYDGNYKCSNCGVWYSTDETPEEAGLSYCPNCGAKMDGGDWYEST